VLISSDLKSFKVRSTVLVHAKPIRSVQMDEMRIVTGCYDNNIYVFDFDEAHAGNSENVKFTAIGNKEKNCTVS
jgi:WD40 repeat protein